MRLPTRDPFILTVFVACVVLVPGAIGLGMMFTGRAGGDRLLRPTLPDEGVLLKRLRHLPVRLVTPRLQRVYAGGAADAHAVLAVDEVFDGAKLVYRLATVRARPCSTCGDGNEGGSLAVVLLALQDLRIEQVLSASTRTAAVDVDTARVYRELRELLAGSPLVRQGGRGG